MIRIVKKIFISQFILLWILIPAFFADSINIQDIIFPSYQVANEFSGGIGENLSLNNNSPIEKTVSTSKNDKSLPRIFFDEDSPSLPIDNIAEEFTTNLQPHDECVSYNSIKHSENLFITYHSLLI